MSVCRIINDNVVSIATELVQRPLEESQMILGEWDGAHNQLAVGHWQQQGYVFLFTLARNEDCLRNTKGGKMPSEIPN